MKIRGQNKDAKTGPGSLGTGRTADEKPSHGGVGGVGGALAGLLSLAGPAGAASPPAQNGEIAFTSARSGHYEVYLTDAEGIEPADSVTDGMVGYAPDLSSDGQKVAFTGRQDGREKVYVAKTDGTEFPVHMTPANSAADYQPVFSPDGGKIAYTSLSEEDGDEDVYVADASGAGGVPANVSSNDASDDERPEFSPDGREVRLRERP